MYVYMYNRYIIHIHIYVIVLLLSVYKLSPNTVTENK